MNKQYDEADLGSILKESWKHKHKIVIDEVLQCINQHTDNYILKGETALMECYGLDRFSEDIDLDGTNHEKIGQILHEYAQKKGYSIRIAKDTDTVQRYFIDYGGKTDAGPKPLKIEISFRKKEIADREKRLINGINVYSIDSMAIMKANAYASRDKIRDLYDVTFIVNNYYESLNPYVADILRDSVGQKGLEQFDYIVQTQKDDLIDENELAENFLTAYDTLGLSNPNEMDKTQNKESEALNMEKVWSDFFLFPKSKEKPVLNGMAKNYGLLSLMTCILRSVKKRI